jgi:hypothetical protein
MLHYRINMFIGLFGDTRFKHNNLRQIWKRIQIYSRIEIYTSNSLIQVDIFKVANYTA